MAERGRGNKMSQARGTFPGAETCPRPDGGPDLAVFLCFVLMRHAAIRGRKHPNLGCKAVSKRVLRHSSPLRSLPSLPGGLPKLDQDRKAVGHLKAQLLGFSL